MNCSTRLTAARMRYQLQRFRGVDPRRQGAGGEERCCYVAQGGLMAARFTHPARAARWIERQQIVLLWW